MKILICLDYSTHTEKFLGAISKFLQQVKVTGIVVFHVIDEQLFYATTGIEVALNESLQDESKMLRELCMQYLGRDIHFVEEYGIPKLHIEAALKNINHDLVIAGSHSRYSLGERLMGSTAEHILRHSAGPVLIIH